MHYPLYSQMHHDSSAGQSVEQGSLAPSDGSSWLVALQEGKERGSEVMCGTCRSVLLFDARKLRCKIVAMQDSCDAR